jgi:hypothetical protein
MKWENLFPSYALPHCKLPNIAMGWNDTMLEITWLGMFNHLDQMYYGPKHDEQTKNWHFMHSKLNKFVEYYDENTFCLIGFNTFITWNPSF